MTPGGAKIIYPSVTTVLGVINKPQLHQWIADCTAAYAVANLGYLQSLEDSKIYGFLRWYWSGEPDQVGSEIREHYKHVRDDSAELGTNLHEIADAIATMQEPPPPLGEEAEEMVLQLLAWFERHEVIMNRSEFTVVDDDLKIAGTADGDWTICCTHDGPTCFGQSVGEFVRVLIDLKTARNTWDENGFQLAGLGAAPIRMVKVDARTPGARLHEKQVDGKKIRTWWIEEENPVYDRYAVLHIRPFDLDSKGEVIQPFCDIVDMTEDIDVYYQGFVSARSLLEAKYQLKTRKNNRKKETEQSNA